MSARAMIPHLDGGSPPRGVLPIANSPPNDSRLIDAWSEDAFGFGGLGPRPQCPWTIRHDYVAPRLLFVFPLLCSCPVLGLGGLLLFNLATLR